MKFYELQERSPEILERLLVVWGESVRATHGFLSEEVLQIKEYVPQALDRWSIWLWRKLRPESWQDFWEQRRTDWKCCFSSIPKEERDLEGSFCSTVWSSIKSRSLP